MAFSLKFRFVFVMLGVTSLALFGVSSGDETDFASFSLLTSSPLASVGQTKDTVTCPVPQNQCASECQRRCSATSHQKPCLFFCNKCCNTCLCVPPGTFGNKECCPCYNNWKTQEGGPKCP